MRRRGLVLGLLALAFVAVGVAVGLQPGERADSPVDVAVRADPEPAAEGPVLVVAPRPVAVPEKGQAEPARKEGLKTDGSKEASAPKTLRLVDGSGQPLAHLRVAISSTGARTTGSTDKEGRLTVDSWRDIDTLHVFGMANDTLLLLEGPAVLERVADGTLAIDEALPLVVRTVDSYGNVRPDQRFLFRLTPGDERSAQLGFWGETTDRRGFCRLGPFHAGTRVDLRPGPRGERDLFTKTDWRTVVVNGTPVDLVVGDMPRLRLRLRGVAPDEMVAVAVLDPEDGTPLFPGAMHRGAEVWTAPALAPARVEVLLGPTETGRVARLSDVAPSDEPLDVNLEQGIALTGHVTAPGLRTPLRGRVRVRGRGFESRFTLGDDGSFRIPGVLDEALSLDVNATDRDGAAYLGSAERRDERRIVVPVTRGHRVSGTILVLDESGEPRTHLKGWTAAIEATSDAQPSLVTRDQATPLFSLMVPAGRTALRASTNTPEGEPLEGTLDLGDVQAPRADLVVELRPRPR